MEVWKDIKGYEGLYQVSNLGRVKSIERVVRNNNFGGERTVQEKILSPTDNGHGYKIVFLRKDGKRKNHYVHRLVAMAHIDNPLGLQYVNHLDYDTSNNSAKNLEWCTQKDNIRHSTNRMRKPKSKCKTSNTGEKYISRRLDHGKNIRYRVIIESIGVSKYFINFDDAVRYRNEVMQLWQNQYFKKIKNIASFAE